MVELKSAFVAPSSTVRYSNNRRGAVKCDQRIINHPLCVRGGGGVSGTGLAGFAGDIAFSGVTGGIGDYIAQLLEQPKSSSSSAAVSTKKETENSERIMKEPLKNSRFTFDYRRTIAYGLFAGLYSGGFQHLWFSKLSQTFPNPTVQLAINQGLIIPLMYYPILLWMVPKIRARSKQEKIELRKKINIKAMVPKNWAFWVPLQFIQFRFIPSSLQVAYCSVCGLIWKIILSFLTAGSNTSSTKKQEVMLAPTVLGEGTSADSSVDMLTNSTDTPIIHDIPVPS